MGAKGSKPAPHRIEPEATAVEVFEEPPPPIMRVKGAAPEQSGGKHTVGKNKQEQSPPKTNGSESAFKASKEEKQALENDDKVKKKRRRSKKDKNKLPPPKLVRSQTQLNELKNVKPLLQQSPQAKLQHFEQIKDAYALDEEAKKVSSPDPRSRLFSFESWRKAPQAPSGKSDSTDLPAPPTRSQTSGGSRLLLSSGSTEEIEDFEFSRDIEEIPLPTASRTSAIRAPITTQTPHFLAASNQVDYGRPDIQTTPVIRVKTSDRRTPERSKRPQSQRSDLHLDDVDEDLMDHILTDDT